MDYTLIRAHKRTLSLQINEQGVLIARAPYLMPKFLIDRFISQKSRWIAKRRLAMSKPSEPTVAHFTPDELKEFIHKTLTKYSALMGLKYSGVRFTHVKTYWGTCAPSGVLSFNLALCFAPSAEVTYVVIHELSHLRWKGHGQRFWSMVEKYYPNAKSARQKLTSLARSR